MNENKFEEAIIKIKNDSVNLINELYEKIVEVDNTKEINITKEKES